VLPPTGNGGMSCDVLAGVNVLAVSSIGNPRAFEATLEGLGARVVESLRFEDHHWYTSADIELIEDTAARAGAERIITTEKDGVRLECAPKRPENTFLLEVELQVID
jgi:tetraacyldisaccharide 4'-kinase